MATIQDVAEKAGVSVTLVSRYINNKTGVGQTSKKKIQAAIDALGYQPNAIARSLVNKKTQTIGVVLDHLCTPFIFDLIQGLEEGTANWNGQGPYNCIFCDANMDMEKKMRHIRFLTQGRVDGIVIYGSCVTDEALIDSLIERNFPAVLIENDYQRGAVHKVLVDNFRGAYEATEYLISQGHRDIAHLAGDMNIKVSLDRLNGYIRAMQDHKIPIRQELIVNGEFSVESGYQEMNRLLDRGIHPSAIFSAADITCFGAMRALMERGISIPEDISIFGFDDETPQRKDMDLPPLSSVKQPLYTMGYQGVQQLLKSIENPDEAKETLTFPTELILRESCKALGKGL